jgi:predicted HTH transcriptional regulator
VAHTSHTPSLCGGRLRRWYERPHDGQTRRAIVRLLLESGSITAADIGRQLGISAAGVRRHLDALVEVGDAEANPAAAWQQAAHSLLASNEFSFVD